MGHSLHYQITSYLDKKLYFNRKYKQPETTFTLVKDTNTFDITIKFDEENNLKLIFAAKRHMRFIIKNSQFLPIQIICLVKVQW